MKRCLIFVAGFCLVLMSGCLSGGSPTVYYTLTAISGETPMEIGTPSDLIIGVGPVSLPAYLERLPIVTRDGPNLDILVNFGSGCLSEEIVRVLKQNLIALTGIQRVTVYPWYHDGVPDLCIRLNVLAFEGSAGKVHLNVQWSMSDKVAGTIVDDRQARIEVPVSANDTETLVAAMSRALEALSCELAAQIIDWTRAR